MVLTVSSKQDGHREPITDAIVTAVADAEDIDVRELPPLWDVIDTDALEELFTPSKRGRPRSQTGHITFGYYGYDVTVESGASVTVTIEK